VFSILGFLVMGYHPGIEDDGVYLAAVKSNLNPDLYPHDSEYFRVQLQATEFDKIVAASVQATRIPVAWTELLWQWASILLIVFGCWTISRQLFSWERGRWAAIALVTAMFTLPVAGTALYLVDQHLHPRNVATALILLAVSRILAGKRWQAVPLLLISFFLHPIMAAVGISFCFFLTLATVGPFYDWVVAKNWQARATAGGTGLAMLVPLGWIFEPPTPIWRQALATRRYCFLFQWTWYEWLGAIGPIVLFWLMWRLAEKQGRKLLARFALAVCVYAVFQLAVAMAINGVPAFVRMIPMQPMRYLHLVYVFLTLVAGAMMGKYLLKTKVWRWALFLLVINVGMFIPQRMLYPASEHLEMPGRPTANPWLQAFSWVRQNTPVDAYFVMDPKYLEAPQEDYHSFRALAERSQLADALKDTAVVTQVPNLGPEWRREVDAQEGWEHFTLTDYLRLKHNFGVDWLLLNRPPVAGLDCRWHNRLLTVCRIP
jgi:hypothetical protein